MLSLPRQGKKYRALIRRDNGFSNDGHPRNVRRGVRLLFPALWFFPCFPVLFHRHLLSDLPVVDIAMPAIEDRFRTGCLEGVSRQVPRRPTHRTAARQAGWASHLLVPANLSVLWASKCAGTKLLNDRGVWSERESLPPPTESPTEGGNSPRVTHRKGKAPRESPTCTLARQLVVLFS